MVEVVNWVADRYQSLQGWARERFADDPREAEIAKYSVLGVCVAAVALLVIAILWLAVAVLGALVEGVSNGLITGGTWALERVGDWHLTEVVTTPVHAYITAHAAGLPTGAEVIWSAWALSGPILWLLCWLTGSSWSARLAWVLYGAGTVAMVYSASPANGRMLAAGIAVLYWGVLSVFALRGIRRRPTVHVHPAQAPTTALEQLRTRLDEQFGEVHARLTSIEAAANDELAARRAESRDH
ncbi:hypothetical protein [Nonomuraea jiangxiensis]|uniref:Uncharacterized protein n=1 Tax=Nonomuraea jiangxiensis TaxID=633440 RepID=A0A1G9AZL6_9ACTN|nr:hypothetical protein [Nonomuraea jiangxiensis]SDK32722.1 hypothetical protein SAMN05421869_115102 [Nonomuraea jiangxiensis]